ncbi:MAG: alcohol dehydrogenase catalytic domain-containing protein [Thermodesulfovibrionales bacterium]|nr:alcohol dehydrogenase catalytic domain-containing protein [Thermodesulfovibrionales bacterium]
MKVAKLYTFDDIRIEDIPIPEVGSNDALIKVKACGICSGDVMPWYIENKAPLVIGHEFCGVVERIGSDLKTTMPLINEGDRLFIHHHAPCLKCKKCLRGDYVQCRTWKESKIYPGGLSEYVLVPEIHLKHDTLLLSDTMTYEDGAMIEPIACVVKSLRRANIQKDDNVVVVGLGVMGLIHVILSRQYLPSRVIGIDRVPFRLKKAMEFGADTVINIEEENAFEMLMEITNRELANVVIVCPNSIEAIKEGISYVGDGGRLVLFTPARPKEKLEIDVNDLYFRDISITTSYSCGPQDTKEAYELIYNGQIVPSHLITHRFPITQVKDAFTLTYKAQDSLKVMINL